MPNNVEKAMNSPERELWLDVIEEEYNLLMQNNTSTLVNRPKDKTIA